MGNFYKIFLKDWNVFTSKYEFFLSVEAKGKNLAHVVRARLAGRSRDIAISLEVVRVTWPDVRATHVLRSSDAPLQFLYLKKFHSTRFPSLLALTFLQIFCPETNFVFSRFNSFSIRKSFPNICVNL